MDIVKIAPSILSCDFSRIGEEIRNVERAGADLIHIDVMDGHFVPNITIGPLVVEAVKRVAKTPLDVHLMIENPGAYAENFIKAGADILTIHAEAEPHMFRTVDLIKSNGAKAGVSLNPSTPLTAIEYIMNDVDLVLIMTVNPGFGGQKYISSMETKIRNARAMIEQTGRPVDLEVDGGIKESNAQKVAKAGANILVMGTEIFHSADYGKKIENIKKRLTS